MYVNWKVILCPKYLRARVFVFYSNFVTINTFILCRRKKPFWNLQNDWAAVLLYFHEDKRPSFFKLYIYRALNIVILICVYYKNIQIILNNMLLYHNLLSFILFATVLRYWAMRYWARL
jgi:hypothetical protein